MNWLSDSQNLKLNCHFHTFFLCHSVTNIPTWTVDSFRMLYSTTVCLSSNSMLRGTWTTQRWDRDLCWPRRGGVCDHPSSEGNCYSDLQWVSPWRTHVHLWTYTTTVVYHVDPFIVWRRSIIQWSSINYFLTDGYPRSQRPWNRGVCTHSLPEYQCFNDLQSVVPWLAHAHFGPLWRVMCSH